MKSKIKIRHFNLVIFAGLVIFSFGFFSAAQENQTSPSNIFLDSDQDGLSDEEEKVYGINPQNRDTDGDGYSDGAEVKAGYDPLKPAPGDKIIKETFEAEKAQEKTNVTEEKNLTDEISAQIAELVAKKIPTQETVSVDDLDSLIQMTTAENLTFDDLPEIDESQIKIKKQKYSKLSDEEREEAIKKDEQAYLLSITYILLNNSPRKITSQKDITSFSQEVLTRTQFFPLNMNDITYFENLANSGQKALEEMKEVEVPESILDLHKKGLKIANYAVSLKDTARPNAEDPVGTITKLSKVQTLLTLAAEFSQEVVTRFAGLEVSGLPFEISPGIL